jgi:Txe/YoeB family toxin of Txe-Axe toxin-antitoxin module
MRGIHNDEVAGYWTNAKCTSMQHINTLVKALKRRPFTTKVLVDVE